MIVIDTCHEITIVKKRGRIMTNHTVMTFNNIYRISNN